MNIDYDVLLKRFVLRTDLQTIHHFFGTSGITNLPAKGSSEMLVQRSTSDQGFNHQTQDSNEHSHDSSAEEGSVSGHAQDARYEIMYL